MAGSYYKVVNATIASGYSKSDSVSVRGVKSVLVEFPDSSSYLASAAVVAYIEGSDSASGTYRTIVKGGTGTVLSSTSGDKIVDIDMDLPAYIKLCIVNTATAAYSCRVHINA